MSRQSASEVRIGLGTVQFGCDYGVANLAGQVPFDEVEKILGRAATMGIRILDTAALYGTSEEVIGRIIGPEHPFKIVTKTDKVSGEVVTENDIDNMVRTFELSLGHLTQDFVYGLLIHDVNDLFKPGGQLLVEKLIELQSRGYVKKIGVSVYTPEQVDRLLSIFIPDLIQVPLNILDQRMIENGHLARLKKHDVEIHARSVFLQGLLLMAPDTIDSYFDPIRDHLRELHEVFAKNRVTPLQGALELVLNQPEVDNIIVGVCSLEELEEIWKASRDRRSLSMNFKSWALDDVGYIDPSVWKLHAEAVK